MKKYKWVETTRPMSRAEGFSSWEIEINTMNITVLNGHINCPGEWVMHCSALNIRTCPLKAETDVKAKIEAIEIIMNKLKGMADCAREALRQTIF